MRNVGSPEIFTEDFSAAIDHLGLRPDVDRNRIGAIGICGLSGMALTAATGDSRIKAVATVSMYDMSRSMSRSHKDSYTREQRQQGDRLPEPATLGGRRERHLRGRDTTRFRSIRTAASSKAPACCRRSCRRMQTLSPAAFFNYYRTPRGFHPRSINSAAAWTATTPMSFFEFPMAANIDMISPRPILLVAGANAHSLYYSEDVYKAASGSQGTADRPQCGSRRPVRQPEQDPVRQAGTRSSGRT